jgi:hypothetical protein
VIIHINRTFCYFAYFKIFNIFINIIGLIGLPGPVGKRGKKLIRNDLLIMVALKLKPFIGRDGRDGDRGPIGQQGYVLSKNRNRYRNSKRGKFIG